MKINEYKLVQKIKELAQNILKECPNNANAQSIIALCEIVDYDQCDKIDIPVYRGNSQNITPEISFDKAIQEQHDNLKG